MLLVYYYFLLLLLLLFFEFSWAQSNANAIPYEVDNSWVDNTTIVFKPFDFSYIHINRLYVFILMPLYIFLCRCHCWCFFLHVWIELLFCTSAYRTHPCSYVSRHTEQKLLSFTLIYSYGVHIKKIDFNYFVRIVNRQFFSRFTKIWWYEIFSLEMPKYKHLPISLRRIIFTDTH